MINLLPQSAKREISAGRANALLLRYIILLGIIILAIVAIFAFTYLSLQFTKTASEAKMQENSAQFQQLAEDEAKIKTFKSNLATAKQILDKQINYSTAIIRISSVVPKDVILDGIDLDAATLDTPTTLTAHSKTEAAAVSLKDIFSASPYFTNVHFSQITFNPEEEGPYRYDITMNITYNKAELLK